MWFRTCIENQARPYAAVDSTNMAISLRCRSGGARNIKMMLSADTIKISRHFMTRSFGTKPAIPKDAIYADWKMLTLNPPDQRTKKKRIILKKEKATVLQRVPSQYG